MSILITGEALVKYKLYVETLPEDIALRNAVFRILPVSGSPRGKGREQELKGTLSFQFESFYPFRGSKKSGDLFVFGKEIVFAKSRVDMQAALKAEDRARQNTRAFETLIDLCDVRPGERSGSSRWPRRTTGIFVRIFNDIYLSPIVIDTITVNEGNTTGELTCHKF